MIELFGRARAVHRAVTRHPDNPRPAPVVHREPMRPEASRQSGFADDFLGFNRHLVGLVDQDNPAVVLVEMLLLVGDPPEWQGVPAFGMGIEVLGHQISDRVHLVEQAAVDDDHAEVLASPLANKPRRLDQRSSLPQPWGRLEVDAAALLVPDRYARQHSVEFHGVVPPLVVELTYLLTLPVTACVAHAL